MTEKRCPHCGKTKSITEFHHNRREKSGYSSWCKTCSLVYARERYASDPDRFRKYQRERRARNPERVRILANENRYRRGVRTPLGTNTDCACYLGIHVAERILAHVFKHIEQMPYGNPGYDFRCGRGYKIDVKSACRYKHDDWSDRWLFTINKNTVADHFLCLAFDDRNNLNPEHVWLLPGKLVNQNVTVSISESTLSKWSEYELNDKLEKVVACCDTLRGENE